ncbi:RNA polymerase sigma factor [bacterium]
MSNRSIETIVELCREGDRSAFNELVDAYSRRLYAFVNTILNDHDATDDIIQETFVRVYANIEKYNNESAFSHWLFKIAHRQILNRQKSESLRKDRELRYEREKVYDENERGKDAPEQQVVDKEGISNIVKIINTLSAKQKAAISLFALEGYSIKEISGIMECSQGTVMSHLHRAKQAIKGKIPPKDNNGSIERSEN